MKEKTINIKGTGRVLKKPDQITITINLLAMEKEYDIAIEKHTEHLQELQNAILELGFLKDMLKTSALRTRPEYENIYKENKNERIFKGYSCTNSLKLSFDFDTKKLSELLTKLSSLKSKPQYNIIFNLKNEEDAKQELLQAAVISAKEKAEILANAAKIKLGDILNISYAWDDIYFHSNTVYEDSCKMSKCQSYSAIENLTPEDIELSDNVSITWEIL